jgi:hypothetical protein
MDLEASLYNDCFGTVVRRNVVMPLATTLNTNEIKDSAGTEQEFTHLQTVGRTHEYKLITEAPGYPHHLKVSHSESGTSTSRRRRSVVRFDKTIIGQLDATKQITISAYAVLDLPVGNMSAFTEGKNVLANLMSFMASSGATTTILFDCTGNGADALVNGNL